MDVCFDCVRHLVVDNETDVLHIDTTTRQVSGNQNICIAGSEGLQGRLSLILIFSRVKSRRTPLLSKGLERDPNPRWY